MPEKIYDSRVVTVEYACDTCGASVESIRATLTTEPPQYFHRCSGCGLNYYLPQLYPHTRTIRLDVPLSKTI